GKRRLVASLPAIGHLEWRSAQTQLCAAAANLPGRGRRADHTSSLVDERESQDEAPAAPARSRTTIAAPCVRRAHNDIFYKQAFDHPLLIGGDARVAPVPWFGTQFKSTPL